MILGAFRTHTRTPFCFFLPQKGLSSGFTNGERTIKTDENHKSFPGMKKKKKMTPPRDVFLGNTRDSKTRDRSLNFNPWKTLKLRKRRHHTTITSCFLCSSRPVVIKYAHDILIFRLFFFPPSLANPLPLPFPSFSRKVTMV